MRMTDKSTRKFLRFWNTPTPFSPTNAVASPGSFTGCARVYAVELGMVEGLSFFFYKGDIRAIHVHYRDGHPAITTYHRLSTSCREDTRAVWIYVPLSKSDRLFKFGVREYFRGGRLVALGTKLLGDIVFGQPGTRVSRDTGTRSPQPLTLVYGDAKDDMSSIPFFGALTRDGPPAYTMPLGPMEWPGVPRRARADRRQLRDAYFTSAPLSDVASLRIYYVADTKRCRGILFKYGDGTARSVGQCRVGYDRYEEVLSPGGLCI